VIVSENQQIQARYEELLASGQSHNIAELLAFSCPPASKTSTEFLRSFGCNGKQFADAPEDGDAIVAAVRKRDPNFSPTGKSFLGTLARSIDDPLAWVPHSDPQGHIQKVCQMRGDSCDGFYKVDAPKDIGPAVKPYAVSDKLVAKKAKEMLKENPKLSLHDAKDAAREAITPADMK